MAVLITAIGVSYLLQNLALLIFGSNARQFTSVVPAYKLNVGSIVITGETLVTIVVSLIIILVLNFFIKNVRHNLIVFNCMTKIGIYFQIYKFFEDYFYICFTFL